eukprot:13942-Eustigmatos_ZCMA.PRE.1
MGSSDVLRTWIFAEEVVRPEVALQILVVAEVQMSHACIPRTAHVLVQPYVSGVMKAHSDTFRNSPRRTQMSHS